MLKIREQICDILPPNCIGCELGVLNGSFSKILFDSGKFSKLYLVDLFSGDISSGDKNGDNIRMYNGEENYNEVIRKFCNNPNIAVIKSDSIQFLSTREDNYFDFIYIDTGHTYDLTVAELALSLKKVKIGGYICGHDYSLTTFPGVYRAVNEFISNTKYELLTTTDDKLPSFVIRRK
jgi:cephalosporin hydroxylase